MNDQIELLDEEKVANPKAPITLGLVVKNCIVWTLFIFLIMDLFSDNSLVFSTVKSLIFFVLDLVTDAIPVPTLGTDLW